MVGATFRLDSQHFLLRFRSFLSKHSILLEVILRWWSASLIAHLDGVFFRPILLVRLHLSERTVVGLLLVVLPLLPPFR